MNESFKRTIARYVQQITWYLKNFPLPLVIKENFVSWLVESLDKCIGAFSIFFWSLALYDHWGHNVLSSLFYRRMSSVQHSVTVADNWLLIWNVFNPIKSETESVLLKSAFQNVNQIYRRYKSNIILEMVIRLFQVRKKFSSNNYNRFKKNNSHVITKFV